MAKSAKCPGGEAHKYQRFKIGKDGKYLVYKCMNPGCAHYISVDLLPGRTAICWKCDSVFQIPSAGRQLWKPICQPCRKEQSVKFLPFEDREAATEAIESTRQESGEFEKASNVVDNLVADIFAKLGK